ncbi:hypothetical protein ABHN11_13330 [Brevibacillus centrosporus]|jgi:hypothetical protein|uniref:hypothetical protein n=1 Tax=Brevibacillus centrosporus TaxID=54910 RepID=UPI0039858EFB
MSGKKSALDFVSTWDWAEIVTLRARQQISNDEMEVKELQERIMFILDQAEQRYEDYKIRQQFSVPAS